MKYFIVFVLIIFVSAYPQENKPDSLGVKENFKTQINLKTDLELYFMLNNIQGSLIGIPVNKNPKTIGLWTSFDVLQSYTGETISGETKSVMLSPLIIKSSENSMFNSVRYILGMAQTAAVGYLAYMHIKKYGLIK